jgi:hypothetical protein
MTTAFVYKWTEHSTLNWYIGSRTAKSCSPTDGYICSSRIVKPMILSNPDNWTRTIIATGSPQDMRLLESEILELFDAAHDPRSYNRHNGDGKFTTTGRDTSGELNGFYGRTHSDETKSKIREASKGRTHSEETRKKISELNKGIPKSEEHKKNLSGENNGMFGKTHSDEAKGEMVHVGSDNGMYGKIHSSETRKKISEAAKNRPKVTCHHCGKTGVNGNMKRYHFDNCKQKPEY